MTAKAFIGWIQAGTIGLCGMSIGISPQRSKVCERWTEQRSSAT
jgi:hypothetical protein